MSNLTKHKIFASIKIGVGVLRVGSGVATGCGVGVLGTALRHRGMMVVAGRVAAESIKGGLAMIGEGRAELKEAP